VILEKSRLVFPQDDQWRLAGDSAEGTPPTGASRNDCCRWRSGDGSRAEGLPEGESVGSQEL
jgi:hypothetical protein